jgi:signal transduction histidine kinase
VRSLYLRIWLTVVAALALFALVSGWLVQRHFEQERLRAESTLADRLDAWGDLIQRSLPGPQEDRSLQAAAINEWSQRLRVPLALDDANGERIATSDLFARRSAEGGPVPRRVIPIRLDDGRTLWVMRAVFRRVPSDGPRSAADDARPPPRPLTGAWWWTGRAFGALPGGFGLAVLLALLLLAVAAGAYPVVRRLTRRLEALERGVEAFGGGALSQRVAVDGRDEVASLANSFNRAAQRIETLVRSHQSLLANASHELRSPLARMKMAVSMLADANPAQRERLAREIHTNIAELDALVDEVLLASRLDAQVDIGRERVDLLALAAEESARSGAVVTGEAVVLRGDERLLRRALRNLLDNARRYGGDDVAVAVVQGNDGQIELRVCDRGPGVPAAQRERIFEPFYRLPGHAEVSGGVGLGLSLVRQIAERHGGHVRCEPRDGGGSCFVVSLPKPAAGA